MKTKKNIKIIKRIQGMTLIEVMIALLIGILLMSGAVTLFINNKRVYKENDQMGRLQENARFAVELITNDVRMASFMGCHHDSTQVNNFITGSSTSGSLFDATYGIEGLESSASSWSPSSNSTDIISTGSSTGQRVTGTDAVTVRYLSGEYWDVVEDNDTDAGTVEGYMTTTSEWALVSTEDDHPNTGDVENNFYPGELLGMTDCASADIFQLNTSCVSSLTSCTANGRIRHDSGGGPANTSPGNTSADFSKVYADGTKVRRYIAVRYFIGNGSYGGPSLYRQTIRNVITDSSGSAQDPVATVESQELLEGVENMQILYGVDTNDDGTPDNYYVAGDANLNDATEWGNVVGVKVALLIRTVDENFTENADTSTYNLLGTIVDPADLKVRRRIFNITIQLRNRISRIT